MQEVGKRNFFFKTGIHRTVLKITIINSSFFIMKLFFPLLHFFIEMFQLSNPPRALMCTIQEVNDGLAFLNLHQKGLRMNSSLPHQKNYVKGPFTKYVTHLEGRGGLPKGDISL